jgi:hypothetical protein
MHPPRFLDVWASQQEADYQSAKSRLVNVLRTDHKRRRMPGEPVCKVDAERKKCPNRATSVDIDAAGRVLLTELPGGLASAVTDEPHVSQ